MRDSRFFAPVSTHLIIRIYFRFLNNTIMKIVKYFILMFAVIVLFYLPASEELTFRVFKLILETILNAPKIYFDERWFYSRKRKE